MDHIYSILSKHCIRTLLEHLCVFIDVRKMQGHDFYPSLRWVERAVANYLYLVFAIMEFLTRFDEKKVHVHSRYSTYYSYCLLRVTNRTWPLVQDTATTGRQKQHLDRALSRLYDVTRMARSLHFQIRLTGSRKKKSCAPRRIICTASRDPVCEELKQTEVNHYTHRCG